MTSQTYRALLNNTGETPVTAILAGMHQNMNISRRLQIATAALMYHEAVVRNAGVTLALETLQNKPQPAVQQALQTPNTLYFLATALGCAATQPEHSSIAAKAIAALKGIMPNASREIDRYFAIGKTVWEDADLNQRRVIPPPAPAPKRNRLTKWFKNRFVSKPSALSAT